MTMHCKCRDWHSRGLLCSYNHFRTVMDRASNSQSRGREFGYRQRQVTTLGKLFIHMCLNTKYFFFGYWIFVILATYCHNGQVYELPISPVRLLSVNVPGQCQDLIHETKVRLVSEAGVDCCVTNTEYSSRGHAPSGDGVCDRAASIKLSCVRSIGLVDNPESPPMSPVILLTRFRLG